MSHSHIHLTICISACCWNATSFSLQARSHFHVTYYFIQQNLVCIKFSLYWSIFYFHLCVCYTYCWLLFLLWLGILAVFCQTNMLLVRANSSKSCYPPLVATKNEINWYPYVDGCGLQCENVLFTEADHAHAHVFIAITGSLCFFCTLFTVVSLCVMFLHICCFFVLSVSATVTID